MMIDRRRSASRLTPRIDTHGRGRRNGSRLALAITSAFLAPSAFAQIDLSVSRLEINQSIQGGFTPLVGGRPTFVRATLKKTGTSTGNPVVDGMLRVYDNGIEIAGSPFFSDNGPVPVKSTVNYELENDTLNFVIIPPTSNTVTMVMTVNPPGPGFVAETDTTNNSKALGPVDFSCRRILDIAYIPIDYRPSGGSVPNLPDPQMLEPGMGDNFLHGIYPTPDLNYHRTDAPSKLWTSSLAGSGSPLISALDVDMQLMVPKPDILYGFVPGGLPYNGQSTIGGKVSMGNTEAIRYQRTIAHEIGHNFGLQHNTFISGLVGIDVEDHLGLPLNLPTVKAATLADIMYAGLLTDQAWVTDNNYKYFLAHVWTQCGAAATDQAPGTRLIVAGACDTRDATLTISHSILAQSGEFSSSVRNELARFRVTAFRDGLVVTRVLLPAQSTADACSEDSDFHDPLAGFTAVIPGTTADGRPVDRIEITHLPTGATRALDRSAHPPTASLAAPQFRMGPNGKPSLHLSWTMDDPDGDTVAAYVRFSPNGQRWIPVLSGSSETSFSLDPSALPYRGIGTYELTVSDGLSVTRVTQSYGGGTPSALLAGNPPTSYILSPDPNTSWLKRSSVALHGSAYDLEDRMLSGASLVWTSNIDGFLGTGRTTIANRLSVGTHLITLTATDSSGTSTVDTATIQIVDRPLPDAAAITCQTNLGFQGPGAAVLSMCGGNLSSGTSSTLELANATPSQSAFLVIGSASNPAPFLGGTLLPLPVALILPVAVDAAGSFTLSGIAGGSGPFSIYVQAVYPAPSEALGYGLSNALKLDFLP